MAKNETIDRGQQEATAYKRGFEASLTAAADAEWAEFKAKVRKALAEIKAEG